MKIKIIATTLLLTFGPTLSLAMGCGTKHEQQAMNCEAGTVYDAQTNTCTPTTG